MFDFNGTQYQSRASLLSALVARYEPGHELDTAADIARQWSEDTDEEMAFTVINDVDGDLLEEANIDEADLVAAFAARRANITRSK